MGPETIGPVMIAVARFPIARKTPVSSKCILRNAEEPVAVT